MQTGAPDHPSSCFTASHERARQKAAPKTTSVRHSPMSPVCRAMIPVPGAQGGLATWRASRPFQDDGKARSRSHQARLPSARRHQEGGTNSRLTYCKIVCQEMAGLPLGIDMYCRLTVGHLPRGHQASCEGNGRNSGNSSENARGSPGGFGHRWQQNPQHSDSDLAIRRRSLLFLLCSYAMTWPMSEKYNLLSPGTSCCSTSRWRSARRKSSGRKAPGPAVTTDSSRWRQRWWTISHFAGFDAFGRPTIGAASTSDLVPGKSRTCRIRRLDRQRPVDDVQGKPVSVAPREVAGPARNEVGARIAPKHTTSSRPAGDLSGLIAAHSTGPMHLLDVTAATACAAHRGDDVTNAGLATVAVATSSAIGTLPEWAAPAFHFQRGSAKQAQATPVQSQQATQLQGDHGRAGSGRPVQWHGRRCRSHGSHPLPSKGDCGLHSAYHSILDVSSETAANGVTFWLGDRAVASPSGARFPGTQKGPMRFHAAWAGMGSRTLIIGRPRGLLDPATCTAAAPPAPP